MMSREEWQNELRMLAAGIVELLPDNSVRQAFAKKVADYVGDWDPQDETEVPHLDPHAWPTTVQDWRDEYLNTLPFDVDIDETSLDDPQDERLRAPGDEDPHGDPSPSDPSRDNDAALPPDARNRADLCAKSAPKTSAPSALNPDQTKRYQKTPNR
jgi:hypothetical protein